VYATPPPRGLQVVHARINPWKEVPMYGNNAGLATDPNTSSTSMSGDDKFANVSARHQETMNQLSRTVAQAEELLRALGNESGEAIDAMRARVSATLRDARERLSGGATQARSFASSSLSQADAFVHANPWRAVAIGAGIGALLAILMSSGRGHDYDRVDLD
jgi:ElaB/YqjD/DUF883 family membrane-anchored ribosome-binding protein